MNMVLDTAKLEKARGSVGIKGKNGERVLIELKKFFAAVEQTTDGVFITDTEGVIEYVNPAFERLTGYTWEEAVGETPRLIKSGLHPPEFFKELWETVLKGKPFRKQVINKTKDGKLFYADHTVSPVRDDRGRIVNFVAMWKDVTEQVLEEKEKDAFVGMASHELKTPVTTLKITAQVLKQMIEKGDKEKAADLAGKLGAQVDKMQRIVTDLLDVSRLQAGKLEVNRKLFDAAEMVREEVEGLRMANEQVIETEIPKRLLVWGDKDRLGQVVENLVVNALKYSGSKRIVVGLKNSGEKTILWVEDFGVGIAKQHQKAIFERFFQALGRETGKKGMGLGLYVAKEIVRLHGGKITVDSQPGKGAKFTVVIPTKKEGRR